MAGRGDATPLGPASPSRFTTPGKPKSWQSRFTDTTVLLVIPWAMFTLVVVLFMYAYHDLPALVYVVMACFVAMILVFLGIGAGARNSIFFALGFSCLLSFVVGTVLGVWLENEYLARYWTLEHSHETTEISPLLSTDQVEGAEIIRFISNAFVDDMRTFGYVSKGIIYCVAPVAVRGIPSNRTSFWAVGEGCCDMRGNFDCGSARDSGDPAAAPYLRALIKEPQAPYLRAIEAAAVVYGTNSTGVQLVTFVADPVAAISEIWDEVLTVALIAIIVDLCENIVAALLLGQLLAPKQATKQDLQRLRMP